jgi:hypothetical protein
MPLHTVTVVFAVSQMPICSRSGLVAFGTVATNNGQS